MQRQRDSIYRQIVVDEVEKRNDVSMREPFIIPKHFKYKLTHTDFALLKPKLESSQNLYLGMVANRNFFEVGEGGLKQLIKDTTRGFRIEGHKFDADLKDLKKNPEELARAKRILKESILSDKDSDLLYNASDAEMDRIIAAHSQGYSAFVPYTLGFGIKDKSSQSLEIIQPENRYINIYKNKDGQVYVECIFKDIPILDSSTGSHEPIGFIPGPVVAKYILQPQNAKMGFQLMDIQTDDPHIYEIMKGNLIPAQDFKKYYCNQDYNKARAALKQALQDNTKDETLRKQCAQVLLEVDKIQSDPQYNHTPLLIELLESTKNILDHPNMSNIQLYIQQADALRSKSWSKSIGNVMHDVVNSARTSLRTALSKNYKSLDEDLRELAKICDDYKSTLEKQLKEKFKLEDEDLAGYSNQNINEIIARRKIEQQNESSLKLMLDKYDAIKKIREPLNAPLNSRLHFSKQIIIAKVVRNFKDNRKKLEKHPDEGTRSFLDKFKNFISNFSKTYRKSHKTEGQKASEEIGIQLQSIKRNIR